MKNGNRYRCTLEVSQTGKTVRIIHENGRVIAELLVHGCLARVAENCARNEPIIAGRSNLFRGELYQLAPYEILNFAEEFIVERDQSLGSAESGNGHATN